MRSTPPGRPSGPFRTHWGPAQCRGDGSGSRCCTWPCTRTTRATRPTCRPRTRASTTPCCTAPPRSSSGPRTGCRRCEGRRPPRGCGACCHRRSCSSRRTSRTSCSTHSPSLRKRWTHRVQSPPETLCSPDLPLPLFASPCACASWSHGRTWHCTWTTRPTHQPRSLLEEQRRGQCCRGSSRGGCLHRTCRCCAWAPSGSAS
mmetsp:Transcript_33011/g.104637  ORF Transcript_33011/g.104637 Transcript_33011/m.104637 type:complete len:202 (+) Transcript_33011:3194-3799(+)